MTLKASFCLTTGVFALVAALVTVSATSQEGQPYQPQINQPGKDVQWVPTPPALVEKMLDLARLTPDDRLVDLGSGDGVLVIAAARRGARARGIEYDRRLVALSKRKAEEAGVGARARFVRGDLFETDFSDATIVTTFLLPSMNLRLRPTFLAMKQSSRTLSASPTGSRMRPSRSSRATPGARQCSGSCRRVSAGRGSRHMET